MKKTVIINNLDDVHVGDMLFVKGRSDGYRVACVSTGYFSWPVAVDNPFNDGIAYVRGDLFDHAERTIEDHYSDPDDTDYMDMYEDES